MENSKSRISFFANTVIIVVGLLLCTVLVKRSLFSSENGDRAPEDNTLDPGSSVSLSGVEWIKNKQTVVLVISPNCEYCSKSAPFYKRLSHTLKESGEIRFIAVLPEGNGDGATYLESIGISADEIKWMPLNSIGVKAVPTLVLIDNRGIVKNVWIGKLEAEEEVTVFAQIGINYYIQEDITHNELTDESGTTSGMDEASFKDLIDKGENVVVLDISSRGSYKQGHIANAKNIPFDELEVRGRNELQKSQRIAIYCNKSDDVFSKQTEIILKKDGFRNVSFLKGGMPDWQQAGLPIISR